MIGVFDSGFGGLTVHHALITAMPEQDLTIWSVGLLFESIVRATRELLHPFELRFAQIRKRDRA